MSRKLFLAFALLAISARGFAADRFGRHVIDVKGKEKYAFVMLDDVKYPTLSDGDYVVSCLVYRGTEHYYVEIAVTNKSQSALPLPTSFVTFEKSGYTVYRGDTMQAAQEAATSAGLRFTPTPPPYVPPTYNTTITTTSTNYGNQTYTSGTATTTEDDSGQAGAELGNAIGNIIAAHRFYKMQRNNEALSAFLAAHVQTDGDTPILPGQSRTIVAIFNQLKQKKKPFTVKLAVGGRNFQFDYNE